MSGNSQDLAYDLVARGSGRRCGSGDSWSYHSDSPGAGRGAAAKLWLSGVPAGCLKPTNPRRGWDLNPRGLASQGFSRAWPVLAQNSRRPPEASVGSPSATTSKTSRHCSPRWQQRPAVLHRCSAAGSAPPWDSADARVDP